MSGPMDVLAWLDSLHATTASGAITDRKWSEAQEARCVVAELIEALQAFIALDANFSTDLSIVRSIVDRHGESTPLAHVVILAREALDRAGAAS